MTEDARPSTWMTWLLIALNVAMFAVELASGADALQPTSQQILRLGGDYAPLTLHGEWWRVGASMFLHFGILHIGMNMLVLWQGRIVEVAYGHLGFLAIYLASGLLGGVGSVAHHGMAVSAGASGAVFGVFGAFGAVLVMRRGAIDPVVWGRAARQLGTFVGINLVIGLQSSTIDVTAHIVGLIVGFVVGVALLAGKRAALQRTKRSLALIVGGIALTIGSLAALPAPAPSKLQAELEHFAAVEHELITKYNAEVRAEKGNPNPDTQAFADLIEHEILPAWRTEIARLGELTDADVPPAARAKIQLLRTYADDRLAAWETYAKLLRTNDNSQLPHYHDLEAKVRADLKALADAAK
ncbi:MAG: rhomboid family intramembrane serine protease [Acidobacteriota bacterium]